jgi:hypothetical protein
MLHVDHICLGASNIYESSARLKDDTGFGYYDGGWFPHAELGTTVFPLGDHNYLEVEGPINHHRYRTDPIANWFERRVARGETFMGWCLRVDEEDELDEFAARWGAPVEDSVGRVLPHQDGVAKKNRCVPFTIDCWDRGLPNVFHFRDPDSHSSLTPVDHVVAPSGVEWLEVGGTPQDMERWLGDAAKDLPLEYFPERAPGLYGIAVATEGGVTLIRR